MGIGKLALWARPLIMLSGTLIAFPDWKTDIIGFAIGLILIPICWIRGKKTAIEVA